MSYHPTVDDQVQPYSVHSLYDHETLDVAEADVLARAYRAMWRQRHGSEPHGPHAITGLGLVILFGETEQLAGGGMSWRFW
ncbi:hypothetical protein [Ideonella sp.]|uniref:hypothetical protein n=1 Tax=Ideonella sp. TaxID=1929293 RepID=UPI003BB665D9